MSRANSIVVGLLLAAGLAAPAAAEDCFPKVRAVAARPHPAARPARPHLLLAAAHHPHHAHRAKRPVGAKRVSVKTTHPLTPSHRRWQESSFAQQTIPVNVPRPVSCDLHPASLLQSVAPMPERPAAQRLLDAIAGPAALDAPGADSTPTLFSSAPSGPGYSPGFAGPPGIGGGPPPNGPNPPPTGPNPPPTGPNPPPTGPNPPPVNPPPVNPPPVNPPPGQPPPVNPPCCGPIPPPVKPPIGAVPEPATWAMLIVGFFSLGGALRVRRAQDRRREAHSG